VLEGKNYIFCIGNATAVIRDEMARRRAFTIPSMCEIHSQAIIQSRCDSKSRFDARLWAWGYLWWVQDPDDPGWRVQRQELHHMFG